MVMVIGVGGLGLPTRIMSTNHVIFYLREVNDGMGNEKSFGTVDKIGWALSIFTH
jgi:hypothetical protein